MAKTTTSGIYIIKNIINGKCYIGQSSQIEARWIHHINDLNSHKHHNYPLQYAWNVYGKGAFIFQILEKCEIDKLDDRERYYIDKFNTYRHGYNLDCGGMGIRGYKHTDAEIEKMRRIQKPPVVLQFNTNYELVNRWIGGVTHISKELGRGFTRQCIVIRCRHVCKRMSAYKHYYWVYEDEYNSPNFTWDNYLRNIPAVKIGDICKLKTEKPILQFTLKGEYIKTWLDINDLINLQYDADRIRMICHHTGNLRVQNGYIWSYSIEDVLYSGYFDKVFQSELSKEKWNEWRNRERINRNKPVHQLDNDGSVIATYRNVREASYVLTGKYGISNSIRRSCQSTYRLSHGCRWKYA